MKKQLFGLEEENVKQLEMLSLYYEASKSETIRRLIERGYEKESISRLEELREDCPYRPTQYMTCNTVAYKAFRQDIIEKRTHCEVCGSEERLELHHLTYERYGEELEEDMILLCSSCHSYVHYDHRGKGNLGRVGCKRIGSGNMVRFSILLPQETIDAIRKRSLETGRAINKYIYDLVVLDLEVGLRPSEAFLPKP